MHIRWELKIILKTLLFTFLFISCTSKITYEGISDVLNGFGNSSGNSTKVVLQNLNNVGVDYFEVELTFEKDDNQNNSAKVYMCSETDSPGCNPKNGISYSMQRQSSKFVSNISGLISPYEPGETINYLIVVTDEDGIEGTLTQQSVTLLNNNQINLSTPVVNNITTNSFDVSMSFSYDNNSNATASLFYCNETVNPGCDPLAGSSIMMTRSGNSFNTSLTSLTNSLVDQYNIQVFVIDSDGMSNPPAASTVELLRIPATQIYRSVAEGVTSAIDSNSTGTMTISSDQATFSSALADNVGVGDVIVYSGNTRIAFIVERISSTVFTVKQVDGESNPFSVTNNSDWEIYRAYSSYADSLSGDENSNIPATVRDFDTWSNGKDIVSTNEQWNLAFYAGGVTDVGSTNIAIDGWTTSEFNQLKLFTPHLSNQVGTSQRHMGVFNRDLHYFHNDAAGNYRRGIWISDVRHLIIDGIQVLARQNGHVGGSAIYVQDIDDQARYTFKNNIFQGVVTNTDMIGLHLRTFTYPNVEYRLANNIIYGFQGTCIRVFSKVWLYNNTFARCGRGVRLESDDNVFKNNLFINVNDSITNNARYDGAVSSHNIFSNTDINYSVFDRVVTDLPTNLSEAHDYRLAGTSFEAIGTGLDLSNDSDFPISKDILHQSRVQWDIGATNAPLAVFRSIGPSNTVSLKGGSDKALSISIDSDGHTRLNLSGGTTSLPANVGVGDVFQYDADGIGGVSHLAFIHKRIDADNFYVKNANGLNAEVTNSSTISWDIFRSYTSLAQAEAGTNENNSIDLGLRDFDSWQSTSGNEHDLISKNTQWNFSLYADGIATYAFYQYWLTDSLRRVKLFSPKSSFEVGESQRHQGVWDDTKSRMIDSQQWNGVVRSSVKDFILEGIQLENTYNVDSGNVRVFQSSSIGLGQNGNIFILGNIFKHSGSGTGGGNDASIFLSDYNNTIKRYVINNLILNSRTCVNNGYAGVGNFRTIYVYHNTCDGVNGSMGVSGDAGFNNAYFKNNISINQGGNDWSFTNLNQVFEGNISSDSTSPSSAAFEGSSPRFISSAGDDFRLLKADTVARGRGLDLSEDEFFIVDKDIKGINNNSFDIGAHAFVDYGATLSLYDELGAGTTSSPYLLANADQLEDFMNSCGDSQTDSCSHSVTLIDDIDMNTRSESPIGDSSNPYTGRFDGNNFSIDNVNMSGFTSNDIGLFGRTSGANISNLNLNITLNGNSRTNVGGLVGHVLSTSIDNVHITGSITNANASVGGICGRCSSVTISNSSTDMTVSGGSGVGGLVGFANNANISSSFSRGDVTGSGNDVGGLIGYGGRFGGADIIDVYSLGNVRGSYNVGGLIGNFTYDSHFQDCFARGDVTATTTTVNSNAGGLIGRMGDATSNQRVTNCYSLGDVYSEMGNVGGFVGFVDGSGERYLSNSWAAGDVKGLGHVGGFIGLGISPTISDSFALGDAEGFDTNSNFIGGFAGRIGYSADKRETTRSFAIGNIFNSRSAGVSMSGGFAGATQNQIISDSYSLGNVYDQTGHAIGGFIGLINSGSEVHRSLSYGNAYGVQSVGGFVGNISDGTITESGSFGVVSSEGQHAGGFVGLMDDVSASISDSFSLGDIYGNTNVGAFVGRITDGSISNTYTHSNPVGTSNIYAFIGGSEAGTLSNNFWSSDYVSPTDGSQSNTSVAGEYEPVNLTNFRNPATFNALWDLSSSGEWKQVSGLSFPMLRHTKEAKCLGEDVYSHTAIGSGTLSDPYILCNAYQLRDLAVNGCAVGTSTNCDKHFLMGADIDLEGDSFPGIGGIDQSEAFTGRFDGGHHKILNLSINIPSGYASLFRYVYQGMIRNLIVKDSYVNSASTHAATFASVLDNSYLLNSHAIGAEVRGSDNPSAGGLVTVMINNSVISHSTYSGHVSGNANVGGIAGRSSNGSGVIQKSNAYMTHISGVGSSIGGIIGSGANPIDEQLTRKVFSTGSYSTTASPRRVGGISGSSGNIEKSWSSMNFVGSNTTDIGGITGVGGRTHDTYNRASRVEGSSDIGSFYGSTGYSRNAISIVENIISGGSPVGTPFGTGNSFNPDWLFFDSDVSVAGATFSDNPEHIEAKTTSELMSLSTYTTGGASFSMWEHSTGSSTLKNQTWLIDDGAKYPMLRWQLHPICQRNFSATAYNEIGSGTSDDPYKLCFREQVLDLGENGCDGDSSAGCTGHYLVLNDMDFEGVTLNSIGATGNVFAGVFNGNNHTFSNISSSISSLFYTINGAVIKNLKINLVTESSAGSVGGLVARGTSSVLENIVITGGDITSTLNNAGGLIGDSTTMEIRNCHFSGTVTSSNNNAGGLVGLSSGGLVANSSSGGIVNAERRLGGLIGNVNSGTEVYFSHSSATVNQTASSPGEIGGLVGIGDVEIRNSYATGIINAQGNQTGGLIGTLANPGVIENSYFEGEINSTASAAGLIGSIILAGPTVSNSYSRATMNVSGTAYGFIGGNSGTITNCFWDSDVSGITTGSAAGEYEALDNIEMIDSSIFSGAGWSSDIWYLNNGSIPKLKKY